MTRKTANPHGDPLTEPRALAYWWLVQYTPEGSKTPYDTYRQLRGACYDLLSFIMPDSGYDPRTNQQWVRVKLPRRGAIAGALVELDFFLPYIKPTEGYKHVGVFEHTCSENGMYELREYGASDICLIKTIYGRESVEARFEAWRAAFEYVQKHHWYGDDDETDE